jgi:hypothetical protein
LTAVVETEAAVPAGAGAPAPTGPSVAGGRVGAPSSPPVTTRLRAIVSWCVAGLGVLLSLLAASPWARAFASGRAVTLLALASVLSVAVPVVVVRVARRPVLWSVVPSIVIAVVVLLVLGGVGPGQILEGLGKGNDLRSLTLPISGRETLLVLPFVLVWLVGAAIGELSERTSARAPLAIVPLAGFGLAYWLTVAAEGDEQRWASLLLAASMLVLCLRAWLARPPVPDDPGALPAPRGTPGAPSVVSAFSLGYGRVAPAPFDPTDPRRDPDRPERFAALRGSRALATRPLRAGAAVVLVLVAATSWVVPNLSHFQQPPVVPTRHQDVDKSDVVAPVAVTAALRRGEAGVPSSSELFRLSTTGPTPRYVPTAQLDAYDGATWRYDRTFEPTGGRVPDDDTVNGSVTVTQVYELHDLVRVRGGAGLPYLPRPRQVDGLDVRYDAGTGMIIPAETVQDGTTYRVESRVASRTLSGIDPEQLNPDGTFPVVAPSPADQDYAFPSELDEDLDRWGTSVARETAVAKGATLPFLAAVEKHFHANYARVEEGPADRPPAGPAPSTTDPGASTPGTSTPATNGASGGTSFAEVAGAIGVDNAGTPEQFATLYALMARRLGVPARIVTGFKLPEGAGAALDQRPVTGAEAWTWVEVPVTSVGWVVVDPTPTATVAPAEDKVSAETSTTTIPRQKRTAAVAADTGTPIAPPGDLSQAPAPAGGRSPWMLVALLVALGLAAVPVTTRVRRALRRRGRQQGNPTERVIGAWQETLDVAAREPALGPALASMTNTEVVGALAAIEPSTQAPMQRLAEVANRALFLSTRLTMDAADAAWADADEVRAALRPHTGLRARLGRGGAGGGEGGRVADGSPPEERGVEPASDEPVDVLAGGGNWA